MNIARWLALTGAVALLMAACTGAATPTDGAPTQAPATAEPTATPQPQTAAPTAADTPAPADTSAAMDGGNGRPVTVTLVLSGTSVSDGTYTASAPARWCGSAVTLTGNPNGFNFAFPNDVGNEEIEDVTFVATDLPPGTTTASFSIGVSVRTTTGDEPPSTEVHPDQANSGDSGTATRVEAGGQTTLTVDGVNSTGENVHLEAHCEPRS